MDVPEYLSRARNAIREGELQMAEQYLQRVLNYNPDNEQAQQGLKDLEVARARKNWSILTRSVKLALAYILLKLGQASRVQRDLEILAQLQPENRFVLRANAECAERMGNLAEAHETYEKLLRLNATDPQLLAADAELLIKLDRIDEAVHRLEQLHKLRPGDDTITHRIRDLSAQSYSRTGIPENLQARRAQMEKEKLEAVGSEEFRHSIRDWLHEYEQHPENRELGVKLAARYREEELYDEANRLLSAILDRDHTYQPAKLEQARVWKETGEYALAVNLFDELRLGAPDNLQLKDEYLQARIAYLRQMTPDAEKIERLVREEESTRILILSDYVRDHPEAFGKRAELGDLLIRHQRVDEAITLLQRLVHNRGWAGKGFYLLGLAFRAKGDHRLAVSQFEKALVYFKDRGYSHLPSDELKAVYYHLGLSQEELGNREGARKAYGEIYSIDINYKDVRERYEQTFLVE